MKELKTVTKYLPEHKCHPSKLRNTQQMKGHCEFFFLRRAIITRNYNVKYDDKIKASCVLPINEYP